MFYNSRKYIALLLMSVLWAALPYVANAGSKKENLVKVAFLYNFTKFMEWPQPTNNLKICINASGEFISASKAIEKRSNSRKTYSVLPNPSQLAMCHMVYLDSSTALPQRGIVDEQGRLLPVLTVGIGEEFAKQGGMIAFVLIENKVKLIINLQAVQKSGLRISSQLLEVAHKVIQGN